jgi:hypothetical protein
VPRAKHGQEPREKLLDTRICQILHQTGCPLQPGLKLLEVLPEQVRELGFGDRSLNLKTSAKNGQHCQGQSGTQMLLPAAKINEAMCQKGPVKA